MRDANAANRATRASNAYGRVHGLVSADAFQHGVNPKTAGKIADALDGFLPALAYNVGCAEGAPQRNAIGMTTHQDDLFRTEAFGRNNAAQSNSAVADDSSRFAGRNARDEGRMVPGAHHIRKRQERRHKRVISTDWQNEQRAIGLRNTKGFRLRALHASVAEKTAMETSGLQVLVTEDTGAVGERERHDHEITLLQRLDLGTDLFNNSDCLVAHALSPVFGSH
jgi:hypothetical protein